MILRPSISDYIDSIENPIGVFRTLGELSVERDLYGEATLCAGNSAVVFIRLDGGRRRALKCYIRPNPHLRAIYDYVERRRDPLLPETRLLPSELYLHTMTGGGGWVDVVEGEWIEGPTLAIVIERAAISGDMELLGTLAARFDTLCGELLPREWAHGDLKPDNIIVSEGPRLALIDCDAIWIPSLEGQRAAELGTPAYRHPGRTAAHFSASLDDYPAMLISASLHALALAPWLYGRYNTTDNLILSPEEVVQGRSEAWHEMLQLFASAGKQREHQMTQRLATPSLTNVAARDLFTRL